MMAQIPRLLMVVGAVTPPGRLAAAIAVAAEAVRGNAEDINVDVMNLAETPIDTVMQVIQNEPVPATLLNPNIDKDLETICHKCLETIERPRCSAAWRNPRLP